MAKLFPKQNLLVIEIEEALAAKAVFVFVGNKIFCSGSKLQTMTLAIANIARLAFEGTTAAGTVFGLVFTMLVVHIWH